MCVRVRASTSTSTVSLLSPTRRSLYLNLCHLLIERLRPPLLFTSSGHTALTYTATAGTAKRPFMARAAQRGSADSALAATKMRFSLNDAGESDAGVWGTLYVRTNSVVFLDCTGT